MDEKKNIFSLLGMLIEAVIEHADGEIRKIKQRVLWISAVAGLLFLSLVFLLMGVVKSLPGLLQISEAASFFLVGFFILIVLGIGSLIHTISNL